MDSRGYGDAGRRGDLPGVRPSGTPTLTDRAPRRRGAGVCGAGRDGAADVLGVRRVQRRSRLAPHVMTSHLARLLAVAALAALPQLGMPAAQAISPPPIDDKLLPKPAPPAPPGPTAQREVCATLTADPRPARNQVADPNEL